MDLKRYRSHKIVEAGEIASIALPPGNTMAVRQANGSTAPFNPPPRWFGDDADKHPAVGDYVVRYSDGYTSWSPKAAFEDGYTEVG